MMIMLNKIRQEMSSQQYLEYKKILLKFIIALLWLIYIIWWNKDISIHQGVIIASSLYILLTLLIFPWIVVNPKAHQSRSILGTLLDISVIIAIMICGGEITAPLFGLYLFILFSNCFQYEGKNNLTIALIGLTSFSILIIFSEYWQAHKYLGYNMVIALITALIYIKIYAIINNANVINRAKNQFLANISHEIRTPLYGIVGMSDLLIKEQLDSSQKECVTIIHSSAVTLMSLLDDILDVSKIEDGKMVLETVDFDLYHLVNSSVALLAPGASSKGLECNVHISPDVPFLLCGDQQHLRQIISNIVANAIKFTEHGQINIHITPVASSADHATVRFSIQDTGIGIADRSKSRIFDTFTQAEESIGWHYGGNGLGTSIAKKLVQLMGGRIDLDSQIGKGSNFWFEITFDRQKSLTEEKKILADMQNVEVLIVNLANENDSMLNHHLEHLQIKYNQVQNINEALDKLLRSTDTPERYYLVIINTQKLDVDPYELLQQFQKSSNTLRRISCILSTDRPLDDADGIYGVRYSGIINSDTNRDTFFRVLHAATVGKFTINEISSPLRITPIPEHPDNTPIIKGLKIIVAEDNLTNQKVTKRLLEIDEHQITIVDNGDVLLSTLEGNNFDLIIIDMYMPLINGVEVTKFIRLYQSTTTQPLIIMLSADVTPESIQQCQNAGIDIHLGKPVDLLKLRKVIATLFNKDQQQSSGQGLMRLNNEKDTHIIDYQRLKSLSEIANSRKFMQDLLQDYLQDTHKHIDKIAHALSKQEYTEIPSIAHTIYGSSINIGAVQTANVASSISNFIASEGTHYAILTRHLEELYIAYHKTRIMLNAYLEEQESVKKG